MRICHAEEAGVEKYRQAKPKERFAQKRERLVMANDKTPEKSEKKELVKQMDTTKEAVRKRLDAVANLKGIEWHSQEAHKLAVAAFFFTLLGVTDNDVKMAALAQWEATPSAFGCNASQMAQKLGRESKTEKTRKAFDSFDVE